MSKAPAAAKPVALVHVKTTLEGIRPPIWRRLVLADSSTLENLHFFILAAMGWDGGHLHMFDVGGVDYSDLEQFDEARDERKMTIKALMRQGVSRFRYTYDFGDNWDHSVLIEKKPPPADSPAPPACVGGARACPPEDCGGWPGYEELIAALKGSDKSRRREALEMAGVEDFDPEEFWPDECNERFANWRRHHS